jgi:hypothetical protein
MPSCWYSAANLEISCFSITTKGQWLLMIITRVPLLPFTFSRLTSSPAFGSGSCTTQRC